MMEKQPVMKATSGISYNGLNISNGDKEEESPQKLVSNLQSLTFVRMVTGNRLLVSTKFYSRESYVKMID